MEYAYGTMGLSVVEFAALTPFAFDLKCTGFERKREEDENNYRKLGWIIVSMNADPKVLKKTSIDDVWPTKYSKEKRETKKSLTAARVNSVMDKFSKIKGGK